MSHANLGIVYKINVLNLILLNSTLYPYVIVNYVAQYLLARQLVKETGLYLEPSTVYLEGVVLPDDPWRRRSAVTSLFYDPINRQRKTRVTNILSNKNYSTPVSPSSAVSCVKLIAATIREAVD